MLIKYYSLKTYREVLRKKGARPGVDRSRGKHRSTLQRCQPGHILSSGAASVAMKSLLVKFPFKGLLQKMLFFPNSPLYQRQLHSRLQRDQCSARWDQHSAG